MIMSEVFFFYLVNLAAIVLDRHLKGQEKQRLLTSEAATELRAASSLLQLTCDAVVELDDKLRFAAPAPDLEAIAPEEYPGIFALWEALHRLDAY